MLKVVPISAKVQGEFLKKPNYRHVKRQREDLKKTRQEQKEKRRAGEPVTSDDSAIALESPMQTPEKPSFFKSEE